MKGYIYKGEVFAVGYAGYGGLTIIYRKKNNGRSYREVIAYVSPVLDAVRQCIGFSVDCCYRVDTSAIYSSLSDAVMRACELLLRLDFCVLVTRRGFGFKGGQRLVYMEEGSFQSNQIDEVRSDAEPHCNYRQVIEDFVLALPDGDFR